MNSDIQLFLWDKSIPTPAGKLSSVQSGVPGVSLPLSKAPRDPTAGTASELLSAQQSVEKGQPGSLYVDCLDSCEHNLVVTQLFLSSFHLLLKLMFLSSHL